jgi:uncharacterized iron-regulated membrane protein
MRQFWMGVHRYLGLATMLFLFLAAATGCFLCFDHAIDATLNPELFQSYVAGAPRATTDAITKFEHSHPELEVTGFPLGIARGRTIEARVSARPGSPALAFDEAYVAPQDGRLIATRSTGPGWDRQHFVQGVNLLHYTLLAGDWGRWLMGVVALLWLIGNGVGFYLTLPAKTPFWAKWTRSWIIDWRARLRWLLLDMHRASGLWLFAGIMTLATTSVCLNFFDEALLPAISMLSPPRPSPLDAPSPVTHGIRRVDFAGALSHARKEAAARGLDWQAASESYIPDRNLYMILLTPSGRVAYNWLGPVRLYISGQSGALIAIDDVYHDSAGRKLTRALYPLHTGEMIGPLGIAIVFVLGLATSEMCITGFYIWWKKRQSRLTMERAKAMAKAA